MIGLVLASVTLALAVVPLVVYALNVRLYRVPSDAAQREELSVPKTPRVSVLIPARDEERSIGPAVESVLASEGVEVEVIVLDDDSRDATRSIVERIAERDSRVSVHAAPPLPEGWCGKQHACWTLSKHARHELIVFLDADVRVTPTGIARAVGFLESSGADLVSGVPKQECGTSLERLVLPLIHFLLLGFLPLGRMRRSSHPAYAAGCGQLFVARRSAYERAGGHAAIRTSLHDGLTLPAAFRRAGSGTDLFDATPLAVCRMYRGARELWNGLAKNATEGLAHPKRIVPATLLLLGGQVLPPALLLGALAGWSSVSGATTIALSALSSLAAYLPRFEACRRFSQPLSGALLHPVGVTMLVLIQWYALARHVCGHPASWKGRAYRAEDGVGGTAHVSGA
jgi:hypothetical protein